MHLPCDTKAVISERIRKNKKEEASVRKDINLCIFVKSLKSTTYPTSLTIMLWLYSLFKCPLIVEQEINTMSYHTFLYHNTQKTFVVII